MPTNLNVNGTTYAYPVVGDQLWGTAATNWAIAVTNGMLQKSGGNFTLTADANFGPNFGLLSLYYKSRSSNIATSGLVRMANNAPTTDSLSWRNASHDGNVRIFLDDTNVFQIEKPITVLGDGIFYGTAPNLQVKSTGSVGAGGGRPSIDWGTDPDGVISSIGFDSRDDRDMRFTIAGTKIDHYVRCLNPYGGDFQQMNVKMTATTGTFTSGSAVITGLPASFVSTLADSYGLVYTDAAINHITAFAANTFTVTPGSNFNTSGGSVFDRYALTSFTYSAYNASTGVFTGVSPNPVGKVTVGDTLYAQIGIPYFTGISSRNAGANTITMDSLATASVVGANIYFADQSYGHWTFGQPGTTITDDFGLINLYAPNKLGPTDPGGIGSGPHLMLHNNDPLHTPNGIISILAMNDEVVTGGVNIAGLDFVVENYDSEGAQKGSMYLWCCGPDSSTNVTKTVSAVGTNTITVAVGTYGTSFKNTAGSFTHVSTLTPYTYATYNPVTGVMAGVSPNPSGSISVSDTVRQTKAGGIRYIGLNVSNTGVLTFGPTGNTTAHTVNGPLTATGIITASAFTGTASGNTTYTPNQYGVVISGSGNAMSVIAPDASTSKVLASGGASANPSWLGYASGNTGGTIVFRDISGNFSAGTITANLTGNASGSAASFTGSLVGDVTGTQGATAISAATVTGKLLTGFSASAGTIAATDSILIGFNKIAANDLLKAPLASPTFTGTVTLPSGSVTSSAWSFGASTFGGSGVATFTGQLIGKGTATNDDPAAGYIGQVITATATGASYSNASNYNDITHIDLTAGDWLVSGAVSTQKATAVTPLDSYAAIGTASGTNASGQVAGDTEFANGPPDASNERTTTIPTRRYSLSGNQTLYLKGRCNCTSGTPTGSGRITAVRIR